MGKVWGTWKVATEGRGLLPLIVMVRLGSPSIDVDVQHDRFITHVLTLITKLVEKVWKTVWATPLDCHGAHLSLMLMTVLSPVCYGEGGLFGRPRSTSLDLGVFCGVPISKLMPVVQTLSKFHNVLDSRP